MSIVIHAVDKVHELEITSGSDKIRCQARALTFQQKAAITAKTTRVENGEVIQDQSMVTFYSLKYGLRSITGLSNADGTPWKLEIEDDVVSDTCLDALMNSPVGPELIFTGQGLLNGIQDAVINPMTQKPISTIKIIEAKINKKK